MPHNSLTLAAATFFAAGSAFAGSLDQPVVVAAPAAPTVVAPPVMAASVDWSGFYAGGQFGFGRLSLDSDQDASDPLEPDGTLYGLHAGYMRDFGRVVLGAELDFDGTSIAIDNSGNDFAEVNSIARAKLRLGYDAGQILPYLTAGAARLVLSSDDEATDNILEDSYEGAFAGLGASYALNDRFVIGAEVLQHRFEDAPISDFDVDVTSITLRGSFRF